MTYLPTKLWDKNEFDYSTLELKRWRELRNVIDISDSLYVLWEHVNIIET